MARPRRADKIIVLLVASSIALPIVGLGLTLSADWLTGEPAANGPQVTIQHPYPWREQVSKPTFVLARGAQVSPLIFGQHEGLFAQYGPTKIVDWNSTHFNKTAVVNGMVQSIPSDAPTVVFVGVSMGGLLAYDAAQQMRQQGDERPIKFIFVDMPTGKGDLYHGSVANFIASLPLGENSNKLAPFVWKIGFRPADLRTIHPRDIDQLRALWQVMRTYPLSGIKGEYGYITGHPRLTTVSNSSAVVIQSEQDNIVKPGAYGSLKRVFPNLPRAITVTCGHGSLLDEPALYDRAFFEALRLLGIR